VLAHLRSIIVSAFFLLYPYIVFRGLQEGAVWLAPSIIAGMYLYQGLKEQQPAAKVKRLLIVSVLILGIYFFQSFTAKLMPTLIQLLLMYFFGKTLFQGPPLIERFVRLEFSEIPTELLVYCRQLTQVWTGFFAFNAIVCSVLALSAPPAWWALYTGIVIFLLTGLLMIGEYIFRHYRFPDLQIPDMKTTARNLILNTRQIWLDLYAK
jgi:uncharacterized membrane protein